MNINIFHIFIFSTAKMMKEVQNTWKFANFTDFWQKTILNKNFDQLPMYLSQFSFPILKGLSFACFKSLHCSLERGCKWWHKHVLWGPPCSCLLTFLALFQWHMCMFETFIWWPLQLSFQEEKQFLAYMGLSYWQLKNFFGNW